MTKKSKMTPPVNIAAPVVPVEAPPINPMHAIIQSPHQLCDMLLKMTHGYPPNLTYAGYQMAFKLKEMEFEAFIAGRIQPPQEPEKKP